MPLGNFEQDLALGIARLEVQVSLGGFVNGKDLIDLDLQLIRLHPSEDVIASLFQFVSGCYIIP